MRSDRPVFFPLRAGRRCRCIGLAIALGGAALAAPPPDLPGEDITNTYTEQMIPADSVAKKAPATAASPESWLDAAAKTWDAPSLERQMAEDETTIPLGMGAVYVPRFAQENLEPDVEVLDSTGSEAGAGKPGRRYAVEPGAYFVMIGSGSHKQRLVRTAVVAEGRTVPIIPDWGGLSIDVINETGISFRGEYELVRMDNYEPYGRGYGADPSLGEQPKVWILKPGLYKILGTGESYNTLKNFVTVQILQGQLIRFVLVENETDLRIQSGGVVNYDIARTFARNWKFGLDLGGTGLFTGVNDRNPAPTEPHVTTNFSVAMLLNGWVRYDREPVNWETKLRLDEGLNLPDFSFAQMENNLDEARLTSLYIWRFFSWFGPYGRLDVQSDVFPRFARVDKNQGQKYLFSIDKNGAFIRLDSLPQQTEKSFSPMRFESGLGANLDILSMRFLEIKLRSGFGYTLNNTRDGMGEVDSTAIDSTIAARDTALIRQSKILQQVDGVFSQEAGPEAGLWGMVRLGRWASLETELKIFGPVAPEQRIMKPDIDWRSTISWRATRVVSIDYRFVYILTQPHTKALRENRSEHSVTLRFSFTSR